MRAVLTSQPLGASLPTILGCLPISRPNAKASARTETVSGPLTLIGVVGLVAWARQRSGIALPDHVDMAHRHVDLHAVTHLGADVVQHAVAHVDGVVEPEDAARRAMQAGEILEHALAPDAGIGVVA